MIKGITTGKCDKFMVNMRQIYGQVCRNYGKIRQIYGVPATDLW